jgi:L-threonylcarbamoyladenylate synthase
VSGEQPDPRIVDEARRILAKGELLIYPTDTLYALGAHALDAAALARLRAAKGREDAKPLSVIADGLAQVAGFARMTAVAQALAEASWPGPLTLVLPALSGLPQELTAGGDSVAVRVPGLRLARELCADGPLVATSANVSGTEAPSTCADAVAAVGEAAALALDAGQGGTEASTIVDVTGPQPVLLRQGAIAWSRLLELLGSRV